MLKTLAILWRLLLAAALLLAAWGKWRAGVNHSPFPETIYDRIVGQHPWLHYTLIFYETALGLWLLSGLKTRWAVRVMLLTLLAFCVLIAKEIISHDPLGCGCGLQPVLPDRGPEVVRKELLLSLGRNVVLMLGAAYVLLMTGGRPVRQPEQEDGTQINTDERR
jgi:uncharacterized membrane protein YphA (DoxX/SURF4 family)